MSTPDIYLRVPEDAPITGGTMICARCGCPWLRWRRVTWDEGQGKMATRLRQRFSPGYSDGDLYKMAGRLLASLTDDNT